MAKKLKTFIVLGQNGEEHRFMADSCGFEADTELLTVVRADNSIAEFRSETVSGWYEATEDPK